MTTGLHKVQLHDLRQSQVAEARALRAVTGAAIESAICAHCEAPVRVIVQPGQKHRRLADHGKKLGILCPGSGSNL